MVIGGRRRIIDPEKIYAVALWSLESDHDAEKIRIRLYMRCAQPGGDSANAAMLLAGLKEPDTA
jgi:hypothetical protein